MDGKRQSLFLSDKSFQTETVPLNNNGCGSPSRTFEEIFERDWPQGLKRTLEDGPPTNLDQGITRSDEKVVSDVKMQDSSDYSSDAPVPEKKQKYQWVN